MKTLFNIEGDLAALERDIKTFSTGLSGSLLLFACDENNWDTQLLDEILRDTSLPIMGGLFPQIVQGNIHSKEGYLLVQLDTTITPLLIEGLDDDSADFESMLDTSIPEELDVASMIIFVDGLSARIGGFVDDLFSIFGADMRYIGGGAGSLSFEQAPCILCNQGVFKSAAVIGLIKDALPVQVGHGWEPVSKGHFATSVSKNVIQEIDYKNALDVYQSMLSPYIDNEPLTEANFFGYAQSFPLGIKKMDGDYVVRDPISINEHGHLICVGELSEGDHIDLLRGEPENLINAASETTSKLYQSNDRHNGLLVIDCISRALFLEDKFEEELAAVSGQSTDGQPVFGALVLGEIANSGSGYLEFYNKTTVVSLI